MNCPHCHQPFPRAIIVGLLDALPDHAPGLCDSCLEVCIVMRVDDHFEAHKPDDQEMAAIRLSPVYTSIIAPLIMTMKKVRAAGNN